MNAKTKKIMSSGILTLLMAVISLVIIIPLLVMILGSFKNPTEAQLFNLHLPTE